MASVGTMIQPGCTGTCQWAIAHQTAAHFARIATHAPKKNQRISAGRRDSSNGKT